MGQNNSKTIDKASFCIPYIPYIFSKYAKDIICCNAAGYGCRETVQTLLATGAEPSEQALCGAAENGHREIVETLLATGLKPAEQALCGAAENGHREIVQMLLRAGTKPSEQALYYAAKNNHREIVETLLATGLKPAGKALYGAARSGHLKIVETLLAAGALINEDSIRTAVEKNHLEILDLLFLRTNSKTIQQAIDSAAKNGFPETVEFIHKYQLGIFVQGKHERLGEYSPIMLLPDDASVLKLIGQFATSSTDSAPADSSQQQSMPRYRP